MRKSAHTASTRKMGRVVVGLVVTIAAVVGAAPCYAAIDIVGGRPETIRLYDVLPRNDSAVTSMVVLGDGRIVGVGSGRSAAHVFTIDPATRKIAKLAAIDMLAPYWSHPTLAAGDGVVFVAIAFDPYALHKWAKARGVAGGKSLVPAGKLSSPSIYKIELATGKVAKMASPVPGAGTIGLTLDVKRNVLYGLSVPPLFAKGSHLFRIDLATAQGAVLGQASGSPQFYDHQVPCHHMAMDKAGNVLLTGNGVLKRYRADQQKIETLQARIPAVPGRHRFSYIEALVAAPDGTYYGGTSDGYLFRLDPASQQIEGFGKPLRQSHVIDLALGDGVAYGVGGEDEGLPRLFSFDLNTRALVLGCTPQANGPGSFGRIGALAFAGGKLWVAEKERNARVFVFGPEEDE